MPLTALAFLAASAALPADSPPAADDRLKACLEQAQTDPTAAIARAGEWLAKARDAARAEPQQCIGQAYAGLQKWNAAHDAFLAARDAALPSDLVQRAHLGAMAGNAALAANDPTTALPELAKAVADAKLLGDKALAGSIETDEARALVALGRNQDAAKALDLARSDAPRNGEAWLLSATLSRRMGQLEQAQQQIETAAALDSTDPAIALEAGVIAELAGNEAAARKNWQAVIAAGPDTPEAKSARAYLAQIGRSGG